MGKKNIKDQSKNSTTKNLDTDNSDEKVPIKKDAVESNKELNKAEPKKKVFDDKKEHNDISPTTIVKIIPKEQRMISDVMTIYDLAYVVATRASHIANGSPTYVNYPPGTEPKKIAIMEIVQKKCPLIIRKSIGHGYYEDWPVNEMIFDPSKYS